jgi:DNA-binding NtrC family response regulator
MARILVVSSHESMCEALMSLATGRGHKLKVTGSAAHFELTRIGEPWDAVFIDVSAGCSEGLRMVALARQRHPSLPIAAVDNGGDSPGLDRLVRAVRLGAVEFMRMPIDRPDAEALMERLSL